MSHSKEGENSKVKTGGPSSKRKAPSVVDITTELRGTEMEASAGELRLRAVVQSERLPSTHRRQEKARN
jgi:hypothetical protein